MGDEQQCKLKQDTYMAERVIEVFEKVGFTVAHGDQHVVLMRFQGRERTIEPILIQRSASILQQDICTKLASIKLPSLFFDQLYDNI